MGIITQTLDTNEEFRNHALKIEGIGDYFSVIVTSESVGYDKPDPGLFLAAAELAGFPPQAILHVGDKLDLDVKGAGKRRHTRRSRQQIRNHESKQSQSHQLTLRTYKNIGLGSEHLYQDALPTRMICGSQE